MYKIEKSSGDCRFSVYYLDKERWRYVRFHRWMNKDAPKSFVTLKEAIKVLLKHPKAEEVPGIELVYEDKAIFEWKYRVRGYRKYFISFRRAKKAAMRFFEMLKNVDNTVYLFDL